MEGNTTLTLDTRKDSYSKRTGYLYIFHFKTEKSVMGQPYEFQLPQEMRDAIDANLAPGASQARREYLVNIGVGEPAHKERPGLPLPVGD